MVWRAFDSALDVLADWSGLLLLLGAALLTVAFAVPSRRRRMNWDERWDALMSAIVLAILVAPVGTFMIWALATAEVALKGRWLYMILSVTMSLGVSWIAIRRLGPAVRGWISRRRWRQ